jgi:hypothetical protein
MLKVKLLELPRTVPPCSELKFLDLPPTGSPCPCVNSTLPTSYNRPWIPTPHHNRPLKKSNFFSPSLPGLQLSYTLRHSGAHRPHNRHPGRHDRKPVPTNSRSRKLSPPRFQQIRGLEIRCDSVPTNWKSRTRVPLDFNKFEVSKSVAPRFRPQIVGVAASPGTPNPHRPEDPGCHGTGRLSCARSLALRV